MKQIQTHKVLDGVLPGFESLTKEIIVSRRFNKVIGDKDNLRLLRYIKSANIEYGIPELQPTVMTEVESKPLAFHEARALYYKTGTLKGYFIHFYIKDELFECVRNNPENYFPMFMAADFVVGLDYSVFRNHPYPVILKNQFDNMVLSTYFQSMGVTVLPNINWCMPIYYKILFCGQPKECTIVVNSKSVNLRDMKGIELWLHGYAESIKRLHPTNIIRFGKIIPGEESIYPFPLRYEIFNPYINAMKYGR